MAERGTGSRAAWLGAGRWALLAALCLLLPPAWALPPPARSLTEGLSRSRALLAAASDALLQVQKQGTLGFECTLEEVDLEDVTSSRINTIKSCTSEDPGPGNCPVLESSTLDMSKCLRGIYEDLKTYKAELGSFKDRRVLTSIDEMMQALQPHSPASTQPLPSTPLGSFQARMRLCGALHAFCLRAATISRMLGYMSALAAET
ncbi:interleukin-12 subunit alpha [Numida meleagris]|uniref:interleukin-12 subunit alpha n=1 Tax=Numida meleagris TaxID=8996 RepID=UPI000B3DFC2D|nr:interleukin-12 subunit alpha [Numida meleagris]